MNVWRLPPIEEISSVILAHELDDLIDWGQKLVGLPEAWQRTQGEGIRVAVLDTGCDSEHPDLDGAIVAARDFSNSRFGVSDIHGHGTHCASVIGARANGRGIRGGAPACQLLIGKVLGDSGAGSDLAVAAGIDWSVDQGAHVISMSLGSPRPGNVIRASIERAKAAGRFVVCAAGNDGQSNSVNFPGRWPETIAVSAINEQRRIARYASRGPEVDVAAPGSNILGAAPGGGYVRMSGTSMATPLVAAVVALTLARHRELGSASKTPINSVHDLRSELAQTAQDLGTPGKDDAFGFGLIQPGALLPDATEREEPEESDLIELCGGWRLMLPRGQGAAARKMRLALAGLRTSWTREEVA